MHIDGTLAVIAFRKMLPNRERISSANDILSLFLCRGKTPGGAGKSFSGAQPPPVLLPFCTEILLIFTLLCVTRINLSAGHVSK